MRSLIVEIERILPGGNGMAHAEGLTIFVPLTAPGDVVRIELDRVKGKIGFGSLIEVIKASPIRVAPPCPYFGRCGGCDFQQLSYEGQLEAKVEIVRDCLHRIAHLSELPSFAIIPSAEPWHYRTRANWQYDAQNRSLGYFEGGTHRICDVEYCAVLDPKLERLFENLRQTVGEAEPESAPSEIAAVAGDDSVSISPPVVDFPTSDVSHTTRSHTYNFNAESFFQINQKMLEPLMRQALDPINAREGLALDLYCGVGLFTLPLARWFDQVIGIEGNATAVKFAKRNAEMAGLSNVRFVPSAVGNWLISSAVGESEFLLLDPPRTGAEPTAIQGILKHKPKAICYVSCDPATLARDLKSLLADYALDSIVALDLFPQTHHVETVVHLSRTS